MSPSENNAAPALPEMRTAGLLATNYFLIKAPEGWVLFDAPQGVAEEIRGLGLKISALVLTHGHFDHIWEATKIADDHDCPIYAHDADGILLRSPGAFGWFFPPAEGIPPIPKWTSIAVPDRGAADWSVCGQAFRIFHIPGHSAGSVAFYLPEAGYVIAGDTLFAGGLGRWDFPGGSLETLRNGIHQHLMSLPESTRIYPGHGPATTVGREARSNRYLRDDFME
ncbi:MAG: MBL fold metallo-hydrolase [Candidatus Methylacidiphilales bacterium]|nr:MBL fold metallo-hydrolase [Candidatus Methylacidiphilales bacterium]